MDARRFSGEIRLLKRFITTQPVKKRVVIAGFFSLVLPDPVFVMIVLMAYLP